MTTAATQRGVWLFPQVCSARCPAEPTLSPGAVTPCAVAFAGPWPHGSGDGASAWAGWPAQPGRVQLTQTWPGRGETNVYSAGLGGR